MVHHLFIIGFLVINTIRKNAIGLPISLTLILAKNKKIKKEEKEDNKLKKL